MTAGVWFVLCDRRRALAMADVRPRLVRIPCVAVAPAGGDAVVTVLPPQSSRPADITVGLSTAPHVVLESAEIARSAAERPDRAAIAAADARYELVWDPHDTEDVFEIVCEIANILASATGGAVYDTAADRFV